METGPRAGIDRPGVTPTLARVAATAAAGVIAALLLLAAARWPPSLAGPIADGTYTGRTRAWFTVEGLFPGEFDRERAEHFSWTTDRVTIRMPRLDRSAAHRLTLRVRSGRSPEQPAPVVSTVVDGAAGARTAIPAERQDLAIGLPAVASGAPGAVVALDVSNLFQPGPQDTRQLGIVVEEISVEPVSGGFRVSPRTLLGHALGVMTLVAAVLSAGLSPGAALAVGLPAAALLTWLLRFDGAFLGPYVETLLAISLAGTGLIMAGAVVARTVRRGRPMPEWLGAAAILAVIAVVKLAFYVHPATMIADALFQVHRAADVHAGQYFFTSITPRPYFEFPYAIGLYVVAMPFWDVASTEAARVDLLRAVALLADVAVGLALYLALRSAALSRQTALAALVLWPFVRVSAQTLCTANLTNTFAQGAFGLALALFVWAGARRPVSRVGLLVVAALLTLAFLSHFSTAAVGVPLVGAGAAALVMWGGAEVRRTGWWLAVLLTGVLVVSYAAYYSRFTDVYRTTAERVLAGEGEGEQSMVAPVSAKVERKLAELGSNFGGPLLLAAAAGTVVLVRSFRPDVFHLVLAAWGAIFAAFTVLGVLTPIEMRANLAAAPAIVMLAALALGRLAERSTWTAAIAVVVVGAIVRDGLEEWMSCLTR